MSYSEENGQIVLRMGRGDYERLLLRLGMATGLLLDRALRDGETYGTDCFRARLSFMDRLNTGNPSYTPYIVTQKEKS